MGEELQVAALACLRQAGLPTQVGRDDRVPSSVGLQPYAPTKLVKFNNSAQTLERSYARGAHDDAKNHEV
jgi:hypothetical protein